MIKELDFDVQMDSHKSFGYIFSLNSSRVLLTEERGGEVRGEAG